jgi:hypothetical protein
MNMVWWLWPVVGAAIGYVVSTRTGLSLPKCMASGILLGPLNAFLLFAPVTLVERGPGKCSYCAETVLSDARVCQHCGAILGSG